ncbi:MAG: T9SS type A sorting domain-containing protein [Candidatus Paceibacterota bacterium]|jgi:hypothetical protein
MNKLVIALSLLISSLGFSQQKSTGLITLNSLMSATITLNNTTSTVTLTLSGPNDRWFALQFGSFATGDGMLAGTDVVYWNNTTLVDARQNGVGVTPSVDAVNNWTLVANTNNSPSTGLRTVVFTRPFTTGDANDYVFTYANSSIDLAWSRGNTAGYSLAYHGSNRGYSIDTPFTTLGVDDFSLRSTVVYPNPSSGNFTLISKVPLVSIAVYTQTGGFITRFDASNYDNTIDLSDVGAGVYLLELSDGQSVFWKKVLVD